MSLMYKRFVVISFPYLLTDWLTLHRPQLADLPFVCCALEHGKKVITAANTIAGSVDIFVGMVLADAKAIHPSLHVVDEAQDIRPKLLKRIGRWCIRYCPAVASDLPDGLVLDVTGCAHLWGGENKLLVNLRTNLNVKGYTARLGMADTIGAAWAVSHFGKKELIETGCQYESLLGLPPEALRLNTEVIERLGKLGLDKIGSFIPFPRSVLRRRFGPGLLKKLDQALGIEEEYLELLQPIVLYQDRLPCLEPIVTATGIEIAIQRLLESVCQALKSTEKGLRRAILTCFRVDGKELKVEVHTSRPSYQAVHLFKLFELKIATIEPGMGIELFMLEAANVEDASPVQEILWMGNTGLKDQNLAELLDRINEKAGQDTIHRYLPAEHYWPERSTSIALSLEEQPAIPWPNDKPRPTQLLSTPELIEVAVPIPDYPPILFRYKGTVHHVIKADGPERIEREWWIDEGDHRDYYNVEDEEGQRYWVFRSGHYTGNKDQSWFLHGFFA